MAASFASGAASGTTEVHGMPSRRACQATPWAMFPALAVYTPFDRRSGSAMAIALPEPRILNDPTGCTFSSFRRMLAGASSTFSAIRGVRRTHGEIRARAASISSNEGPRIPPSAIVATAAGQLHPDPATVLKRPAIHHVGRGQVLHGQSHSPEDRDVLLVLPAGDGSGQHLADLPDDVVVAHGAL